MAGGVPILDVHQPRDSARADDAAMASTKTRRPKRRTPQAAKLKKKPLAYAPELDGDRDQFERLLVEAARARVNRSLSE